jgi:glutathione synthase/RimK-type ligase-like ATP-grasp enzyme
MLTIAIQPDRQRLTSGRTQSFSDRWFELAAEAGYEARTVDVQNPEFFSQLEEADGFMWWFAHLPYPRNLGMRIIPAIEHAIGIPTFPNRNTIWHFDDKISQAYLLRAAGIPTAKTWIFWDRAKAREFCRTASYPLVLKLASGITSENVRLVRNAAEAEYWIHRLFGNGVVALNRRHRQYAKAAAHHALTDLRWQLTGETPVRSYREPQRGYLLLQEFLPGNEFDTRVTVIGNRAFAFRRFNRPNDFRASGSGKFDWNPAEVNPAVVRLALRTAHTLGPQSLAVDGLLRDGDPVLVEVNYYYEGWAVEACPGHWELRGDPATGELKWVDGHVPPEDTIFEDFVARLQGVRGESGP